MSARFSEFTQSLSSLLHRLLERPFQKRNGVSMVEFWEIDCICWVGVRNPTAGRLEGFNCLLVLYYSLFSPRVARVGNVMEVKQVLAVGRPPASHDRG